MPSGCNHAFHCAQRRALRLQQHLLDAGRSDPLGSGGEEGGSGSDTAQARLPAPGLIADAEHILRASRWLFHGCWVCNATHANKAYTDELQRGILVKFKICSILILFYRLIMPYLIY